MPHSKARVVVATLIGLMTSAACVLIALDGMGSSSRAKHSAEFQELVGGLGGGPAVDLSRCTFSFDPRLCDDCRLNHEPVPGSVYFCQQHACSILYYPPPGGPKRKGTGASKTRSRSPFF